eukprot:766914-Hanusia_phi.AAC.3
MAHEKVDGAHLSFLRAVDHVEENLVHLLLRHPHQPHQPLEALEVPVGSRMIQSPALALVGDERVGLEADERLDQRSLPVRVYVRVGGRDHERGNTFSVAGVGVHEVLLEHRLQDVLPLVVLVRPQQQVECGVLRDVYHRRVDLVLLHQDPGTLPVAMLDGGGEG